MAVVDGLGYSLKGNGTGAGNDFGSVGAALTDLAAVAGRTGCTVFGLTHLGKAAVEALMAAIGSTAWSTVPRISWVIGLDPEDPEPDDDKKRRLVSVSKSNHKKPGYSLSFRISEDETETGYASELRRSKVKADELTQGTPEDKGERAEAKQFLREVLANGRVEQKDLKSQAEQQGISYSTLKRAKDDLGIDSRPERNTASKRVERWWWSLPGTTPAPVQHQESFDD